MVRYSSAQFHRAKRLLESGTGIRATARALELPYSTVRYWCRLKQPPGSQMRSAADWAGPTNEAAYSYLLGLYLGDGSIGMPSRGGKQLILTLDARYPGIVDEAAEAIRLTMPDVHVGQSPVPGAVRLHACHPAWALAFPQHGPGRKHTRRIVLVRWQQKLVTRHPYALIRGLIHSDGSRVINRFETLLPSGRVAEYAYVRYFFTNYSADIRRIFCEQCDLLGIHWTQSSFKNISIAHRDSVAILDSFIGPKR
jgi:hypothetical protein